MEYLLKNFSKYEARTLTMFFLPRLILSGAALFLFSCHYTFKDITISPGAKTVAVHYIENRARYKNPQLSPQLTERLRIKVNNQTRLTNVTNPTSDDSDYDIQ